MVSIHSTSWKSFKLYDNIHNEGGEGYNPSQSILHHGNHSNRIFFGSFTRQNLIGSLNPFYIMEIIQTNAYDCVVITFRGETSQSILHHGNHSNWYFRICRESGFTGLNPFYIMEIIQTTEWCRVSIGIIFWVSIHSTSWKSFKPILVVFNNINMVVRLNPFYIMEIIQTNCHWSNE